MKGYIDFSVPKRAPRSNEVMLQWRCKRSQPHSDCLGKKWQDHGPIPKSDALETVKRYNFNSDFFDYRIKKVDKGRSVGDGK